MKGFITKGMISLMIDILTSLLSKDDLFENFFSIDKIYFASVSLNNIELQLDFGRVSNMDPLCKVICVAKFELILLKNVLNPSVISFSLCSLLLSIITSGNLLMCDCCLQMIYKKLSTFLHFYFYVYLSNQKNTAVCICFNISINLFLYFLYLNSSWRV